MVDASDQEGLSGLYQIIAIAGAAVAGGLTWVFGRSRAGGSDEDRRDAEMENLRRTAAELQSRLERSQTNSDLHELRTDLEKVMGAFREAIYLKVDTMRDALSDRLSALERTVYAMKNESDQRRRDRDDGGNR